MGFTYKVRSSFCSLFMHIVVSRKFTLFCEYSISNLIVGIFIYLLLDSKR